MVYSNQRAGFAQYNSYAMNMDRKNQNCHNCGGFRHLARNYRNRGTGNKIRERKRLEYRKRRIIEGENKNNNNLNGNKDLIVLN